MTEWNENIDEAPRGETVQRKSPKGDGFYEEFVPTKIIAASKCGKVTLSYWIPKTERWCMFGENESPVAWMPWPEHPFIQSKNTTT